MTDTNKYDELLNALISGDISKADRYVLEKKALDDPMLFDAIEGLTTHADADHVMHINAIQDKIKKEKESKLSRLIIFPVAIAASILLLFTIGNVWINKSSGINEKEESLVMKESATIDADGVEVESPPVTSSTEGVTNNTIVEAESQGNKSIPAVEVPPIDKKITPSDVVTAPPPAEAKKIMDSPVDVAEEVNPPVVADADVKKNKMETGLEIPPQERTPLSKARNLPFKAAKSSDAMAMAVDLPIVNEELNKFVKEKYEATFGKIPEKTTCTFGIIFKSAYVLDGIRLIDGPDDIGNRCIPFIEEYKQWKSGELVLGKEYKFSFISN